MTAITTSPEQVLSSTTPITLGPTILLSSSSTLWLIIVLACVAAGAFVLLGCCMLCYRSDVISLGFNKDKYYLNQISHISLTQTKINKLFCERTV